MKKHLVLPSSLKRRSALAIAIGVIMATASCASGGSTPVPDKSASSSSGKVQANIVVHTAPGLAGAPIFLGSSEGIYTKHGLTIEASTGGGPSDAVPLLLKGSLDFAMVDLATAINATQQNVGLVAVVSGTAGNGADRGGNGIVGDSAIKSFKGLVGKNVQVSSLGGTSQLMVSAGVAADGGDPSKVNFLELPPPQAIAALQSHRVDAIVTSEPNVSAAEALGFSYIGNPDTSVVGVPLFVYVTSKAYAAEHPQVVKQFTEAVLEANAYTNAQPDAAKDSTKDFTKVDASLLKSATMPLFGEKQLDSTQIKRYIDLMVTYGGVDKGATPNPADVLWSGGSTVSG